jgi:pimeloyl-ACP methyl ester carboxylesterase
VFNQLLGVAKVVIDARAESGNKDYASHCYGLSQGCAISIAYAARHPDRVTQLILYGGFARGRRKRGSQEDIAKSDALETLIRQGWGQDNPALLTSLFMPDATTAQMDSFNDLQRITTSREAASHV